MTDAPVRRWSLPRNDRCLFVTGLGATALTFASLASFRRPDGLQCRRERCCRGDVGRGPEPPVLKIVGREEGPSSVLLCGCKLSARIAGLYGSMSSSGGTRLDIVCASHALPGLGAERSTATAEPPLSTRSRCAAAFIEPARLGHDAPPRAAFVLAVVLLLGVAC